MIVLYGITSIPLRVAVPPPIPLDEQTLPVPGSLLKLSPSPELTSFTHKSSYFLVFSLCIRSALLTPQYCFHFLPGVPFLAFPNPFHPRIPGSPNSVQKNTAVGRLTSHNLRNNFRGKKKSDTEAENIAASAANRLRLRSHNVRALLLSPRARPPFPFPPHRAPLIPATTTVNVKHLLNPARFGNASDVPT